MQIFELIIIEKIDNILVNLLNQIKYYDFFRPFQYTPNSYMT